MTFCGHCGAQVSGPFCGQCGTPAPAPARVRTDAGPSAPAPDAAAPREPHASPVAGPTTAGSDGAYPPADADPLETTQVIPSAPRGTAGAAPSVQPVTTPHDGPDESRYEAPRERSQAAVPPPVSPVSRQTPTGASTAPPPVVAAAPVVEEGPAWKRPALVGGAVALVALLGLGGAYATGHLGGASEAKPRSTVTVWTTPSSTPTDPAAAAPATGSASVPATSEATPAQTTPTDPVATTPSQAAPTTAAAMTDAQARQALDAWVAEDRGKYPVRGQWVAQLSSKYEGIVDRSQKATPFSAVDIYTEVDRHRHASYGYLVRVVHQGDWAGSHPGPKTMWVTIADIDASSRDSALAWCQANFPQRGKALENVCYPRQMRIS